MKENKEYDFVIVGGGLGGLQCAFILADEGYSVIVLEKNHQLGGNLQVFSRDKCLFDTGVHYLGGLDEGQNLYKFFKYFNLYDNIKLRKMDEASFDRIRFGCEEKEYYYAQGYDNFVQSLSKDFPGEEKAIEKYVEDIKGACEAFPMYNLKKGTNEALSEFYLYKNTKEYISELTENDRLRNVLAGNNLLYAGIADKTPLYVHALVVNSYIESSYRCVDGGSQIAKVLAKEIRKRGGDVVKRADVISANFNEKNIESVNLKDGRVVKGKKFISNAHPSATIDLFGADRFRKAYVNRIKGVENSLSTFIVHLVFHENAFEYINYNIYQYNVNDVWEPQQYTPGAPGWPQGYMMSVPASSKSEKYAECMSVMAYMSWDEMKPWADSYNTIGEPGERGESYEAFKEEKKQLILNDLELRFPGILKKVKSVHTSTPITFRDYIGNLDGNMYGMTKDCDSPMKSFINPKTKIPNLFLTGSNINLHGILGVSISAFVTCFEFLERDYLINKVNERSEVKTVSN